MAYTDNATIAPDDGAGRAMETRVTANSRANTGGLTVHASSSSEDVNLSPSNTADIPVGNGGTDDQYQSGFDGDGGGAEDNAIGDKNAEGTGIVLTDAYTTIDNADTVANSPPTDTIALAPGPSQEGSIATGDTTDVGNTSELDDRGSGDVALGGGVMLEDEQDLSGHREEDDKFESGGPIMANSIGKMKGTSIHNMDDIDEKREPAGSGASGSDHEGRQHSSSFMEDRQPAFSFSEDREPTPSFVEEQGGDKFDMDGVGIFSTLPSAGTRESSTIMGSRTPRRSLSGGLLGTQARRSYFSRQSSGNLQSMDTQGNQDTANGMPPIFKANVGTPPSRVSAGAGLRGKSESMSPARTSEAGSTSDTAPDPGSETSAPALEGLGGWSRTQSAASALSDVDTSSVVKQAKTPTRPWITRSGSMGGNERAVAAAQSGDLNTMEAFLAGGGDMETRDSRVGMTLLGWAARRGHVEMVRLLLIKGANLAAGDGRMRTALHRACSGCAPEVVKLLLAYGADPETRDLTLRSPLHRAARWGSPDCALLLLDAGSDIEARDQELGRTPLHYASRSGGLDTVLLLLQNGANIEAKTVNGNTPLHLSCDRGLVGNVKLLLEWGANPQAVNEGGKLPVDVPAPWVDDPTRATLRELLSHPQVPDGDERPRPTICRARPPGAAEADVDLMKKIKAEHAARKDSREPPTSPVGTSNGERSGISGKVGLLRSSITSTKAGSSRNEPTRGLSTSSQHGKKGGRSQARSGLRSRSKPGEGGLPGANRSSAASRKMDYKRQSSMGGMGKERKMQAARVAKSRGHESCCTIQFPA